MLESVVSVRSRTAAILLDFDGVIAVNSIALQRDQLKRCLDREGAVGNGVVDDLIRAVSTMVGQGVSLELLTLLYGVAFSADDLAAAQRAVATELRIDPAFETLISACQRGGVWLRVLSVASPRLLGLVPGLTPDMICPPPGRSKADPETFRRLELPPHAPRERTLVVDDTPMVLRAAKLAGYQTLLVRGSLYDALDRAEHGRYIDHQCDSLSDVIELIQD